MITNFKQQRIMKPIYNVWILLFCLTFSSCYDEDIIDPTPDPLALAGGIEFPQGDNPWDNDALEIYKNFGVKLIYKNITEKDLNKNWTNGGLGSSSKIFDNCLNDEMGAFYITFMKDHVFPYLNREVTDRVFPMYWYFIYNYSSHSVILPGTMEFNVALLEHDESQTDCWLTCFWGDAAHCSNIMLGTMTPNDPLKEWKSPIAGNKDSYAIRRFKIIDEIIRTAITRGNIIIPEEEFDAGFDHSTPLIIEEDIESKADANYYLKRGYPGNINSYSADYIKPATNPSTAKETFIGYLQIAMRLTKEEREAKWPSATYPFLSSKFDFVTNYLKKYNIDLEAIAQGPEDWDIKPYPELPELPETDEGDDDDDDDSWPGWDW